MYSIASGAARDVHNFVDAEIALAGRRRSYRIGFVGKAHVKRFAIHFTENGCGANAEFAAGAQDAHGDLAAIGNQDFPKHSLGARV